MTRLGKFAAAAGTAAAMGGGYLGLVTGAVPLDLGLGRRIRPLGPFGIDIAAPPEIVFDVLSEPYLVVIFVSSLGVTPLVAGGRRGGAGTH